MSSSSRNNSSNESSKDNDEDGIQVGEWVHAPSDYPGSTDAPGGEDAFRDIWKDL